VPTPGGEAYKAYIPGQLAAASVEFVERIQRQFLTTLEAELGEALQTPVSATVRKARQVTMKSILDNAEPGGCTIALDLSPLRGCVLLDFPSVLLIRVIDILLASPPATSANSRGSVTEIELHILREVFDIFIKSLQSAWQTVYPVEFKLLCTGLDEIRQTIAVSDEVTLTSGADLSIGDTQAWFETAIPGYLARVAEIRSRDLASLHPTAAPVQENLLAALARANVRVEAVLQGASVRMGDLVAMREGQILLLGTPPDSAFDCLVNGKAQFKGEMVATGTHQGFQIE
jgi:flagellar motor switch protein FliM